jgi:hypothetical protein
LEAAKKLNQKMPDDVMLYGFLTDANAELGNYHELRLFYCWFWARLPDLHKARGPPLKPRSLPPNAAWLGRES